jgi:predicted restriction endonuclease
VCDIAIPEVLDAAHVVDKEHNGTDDRRNGLGLCVLHHRMFDAKLFSIEPETLELRPLEPYTLADLRISRTGIGHLQVKPHHEALRWRWERRLLPGSG